MVSLVGGRTDSQDVLDKYPTQEQESEEEVYSVLWELVRQRLRFRSGRWGRGGTAGVGSPVTEQLEQLQELKRRHTEQTSEIV